MPRKPLIWKAFKNLATVFGVAYGCNLITELVCSDDKTVAKAWGYGQKVLKSFLQVTGNLLGEQFGSLTARIGEGLQYGLNANLETAVKTAYKEALDSVRKDFIRDNKIEEPTAIEQLGFFTDHLLQILSDTKRISEVFEKHQQLDAEGYLKQIFNHESISYPYTLTQTREELQDYFVASFKKHFPHYFTEQLKTDEKAKTVYIKKLLEAVIVNTKDIPAHFKVLKGMADQAELSLKTVTTDLQNVSGSVQQVSRNIKQLNEELSAHLLDISKQLNKIKQLVEKKAEPFLEHRIIERNATAKVPQNRFDFRTRYTRFIGRRHEKSLLWDFIDSEENFCWWMITGPGGMGKSRLAQEFCATLREQHYHAGFYDLREGEADDLHNTWEMWKFNYPTLIVIDYALNKIPDVEELIVKLSVKCDQEKHKPVRVLLIDRETRSDWETSLKRTEINLSVFRIQGTKQPVLQLSDFGEDNCWELIVQAHEENNTTPSLPKKEILEEFKRLDPEQSPLHAFFTGVALAEGESIRHWNITNLLEYHQARLERKVWDTVPLFKAKPEEIKKLLLINTLTRNLDLEQIKKLAALLGIENFFLPDEYSRLCDTTTNNKTNSIVWLGLMPDIPGEYFVVSHLHRLLKKQHGGREMTLSLLKTSWEIQPQMVWWMCWLCIKDFSKDYMDVCNLMTDDALLNEMTGETAEHASKFLFNSIYTFGADESTIDIARELYSQLRYLTVKTRSVEIYMVFGDAVGMMIRYLAKIETLQDEAVRIFEEFNRSARLADSDEASFRLVKASYSIIDSFSTIQSRRQYAENEYINLKELVGRLKIADAYYYLSSAAHKLISAYTEEKQFSKNAESLYGDIKQYTSEYPSELMTDVLASAFKKIVGHYIEETVSDEIENTFLEKANQTYEEIKELAAKYHSESLDITRARAAYFLAYCYCRKDDGSDRARQLYAEGRKLAHKIPVNNASILQAGALYEMTEKLAKTEDEIGFFKQLYDDLKQLADLLSQEEFVNLQAKAANFLIMELRAMKSCERWLEELYKDISDLAVKHPADYVREIMAASAFVLLDDISNVRYQKPLVHILYNDLKHISTVQNNTDIKGLLAGAARNMITFLVANNGSPERIDQLYYDMREASQQIDMDDDDWLDFAQITLELIKHFVNVEGLGPRVEKLHVELRQIAAQSKNDEIWTILLDAQELIASLTLKKLPPFSSPES